MASTYLSLQYHLVFSTRAREPLLGDGFRIHMHEYLAGTVVGLKGHCRAVGGTADHVHLLVGLQATHALADFMRELKKASSKWARSNGKNPTFAWQERYAAFTVSASGVEDVRRYIADQEAHHRVRGFREELMLLLRKSGVSFEERFLD